MDTDNAQKALQQLAKEQGLSVETVRREIESAIRSAQSNPSPQVQAFWKSIPCKNELPTPEEALTYIINNFNKLT